MVAAALNGGFFALIFEGKANDIKESRDLAQSRA